MTDEHRIITSIETAQEDFKQFLYGIGCSNDNDGEPVNIAVVMLTPEQVNALHRKLWPIILDEIFNVCEKEPKPITVENKE